MDAVYLWRFDFIPIMRFPSCSTVSLNLYDVMVFESAFMDAVTYSFYKRVETVLEEGECIVDAMSCTHKKEDVLHSTDHFSFYWKKMSQGCKCQNIKNIVLSDIILLLGSQGLGLASQFRLVPTVGRQFT